MPSDDLSIAIPQVPKVSIDDAAREMGVGPPEDRAANPMARETYEFTVSVVRGDGSTFKGVFKNKALSQDERIRSGLVASRIVGGVAWALLDPDTQFLAQQAAHLTLSLVGKPDGWSLSNEKNVRVIGTIWEEVSRHEAFFRGPETAPTGGVAGIGNG